jgi:hypothetical protein
VDDARTAAGVCAGCGGAGVVIWDIQK